MTPPDSGEHMRCADPDCELCAAIRAIKPDSDAREVCTTPFAWSDGMVQCELPRGHDGRHDAARRVILPLHLAQRILAALEWVNSCAKGDPVVQLFSTEELQALAAELRERLPR